MSFLQALHCQRGGAILLTRYTFILNVLYSAAGLIILYQRGAARRRVVQHFTSAVGAAASHQRGGAVAGSTMPRCQYTFMHAMLLTRFTFISNVLYSAAGRVTYIRYAFNTLYF